MNEHMLRLLASVRFSLALAVSTVLLAGAQAGCTVPCDGDRVDLGPPVPVWSKYSAERQPVVAIWLEADAWAAVLAA
jgi:hypothetical protein